MSKCWTNPAVWINSKQPPDLEFKKFGFQWQNKWKSIGCSIKSFDSVEQVVDHSNQFVKHEENYLDPNMELTSAIGCHSIERNRSVGPCLFIELDLPMRCIASGQWAALYDGDVCLGGVMIGGSISLWEEGQTNNYTAWNLAEMELNYMKV